MQIENITIEIIRSKRKTLAIQIKEPGKITVRAPLRASDAQIRSFIESKRDKIIKMLQDVKTKAQAKSEVTHLTSQELQELANQASKDLPERVQHYASLLGVTYGRITIRAQKTLWGSCSGKGNLNFNVLLMLAPEDVRNYVVIHELCHRKEMNHSTRFWAEVERIMPNYKEQRKWLNTNGSLLMAKLGY
ncbi:MAG: M48 family metallopeptidase [Coriobacteriales bacterium]|nr:M48 family metallopeptidase [Coriobacteriales bacterium]